MRPRSALALAAACASLSGCSALGPAASPKPPAGALGGAKTTHELASPALLQTPAEPGAPTPEQAVRRFADAYINWTADTVQRDMQALAAAAIGQARSALQLAAAQTGDDYELKRGGIANSGTVEVVAPLPASRNRYVVVTRESTTATDNATYRSLRPAWHLAIATATRLRGEDWVLSGWQPQS